MVMIDDGHNHDDCDVCPRCQFIGRVAEYLTAAASDGADEWHHDVGQFIERMHGALGAFQRLWAENQTAYYTDEIDNAGEAARALVELYERMHALHTE
jgi:hypothetical protein